MDVTPIDAVDALTFKLPFFASKKKEDEKDSVSKAKVPCQVVPTAVAEDSDFYNMNHPRRGKALIFNHYSFNDKSLPPREGTQIDAQNLKHTLTMLKFDITVCDDYTFGKIYDKLHEVASEDHSDADCLMIVVMSHGDANEIHAKDHHYSPEDLWTPFTGDKCPSLAGKPKLFFIQACRGDKLDAGVNVSVMRSAVTDAIPRNVYKIPSMADFLIMYSTAEGHFSFRSPSKGSWLMQCLCSELENRANINDLITILTFVNRRMAIGFESNVPSSQVFHRKKQIGSVVSSLTRILYFF